MRQSLQICSVRIPVFGEKIVTWLWGNFSVDDAFLNRAFILHWLIAFGIIGVVVFHVIALHITGSNNPAGVEPVDTRDDKFLLHI